MSQHQSSKSHNTKSSRPGQNRRPKQNKDQYPVSQVEVPEPVPAQAKPTFPPKKRTSEPRVTGLASSFGDPSSHNKALFAPKAQSTTPSVERNDVLLSDAILVDGISVGVANERDRHFQLDYAQYIQLINSSYRVMTRQDRALQKHLSLSQYTYYCVILLWKRLKYVLTARGTGVNEYEALRRKLPPMVIPEEIGYYLDGIGNIIDYNDRRFYLSLQSQLSVVDVLGVPGHYNRVDAQTHICYETLPSPFVAVLRLLYDLALTNGLHQHPVINLDPLWDLPNDINPGLDNLLINRNLLGWNPASVMTDEQVRACAAAGIAAAVQMEDEAIAPQFEVDGIENFQGLPLIYPLLLAVSELLSAAKSSQSAYNAHAEATSTTGSVSIVGYNQRKSDAARHTGLHLMPLYERESTGLIYTQASVHIMSAISLFRYRTDRVVPGFCDSLCYNTRGGGAPVGWEPTANAVFTTGNIWNHDEFRTTMVSGRQTCDNFSHNRRHVPHSERQ